MAKRRFVEAANFGGDSGQVLSGGEELGEGGCGC